MFDPCGPSLGPHSPTRLSTVFVRCPVGIEMSCANDTVAGLKACSGTVAGCSFSRADAPNCDMGDIP